MAQRSHQIYPGKVPTTEAEAIAMMRQEREAIYRRRWWLYDWFVVFVIVGAVISAGIIYGLLQ